MITTWQGHTFDKDGKKKSHSDPILQSLAMDWLQNVGILSRFKFKYPAGAQAVLSATRRASSFGIVGVSCFTSIGYSSGLLLNTLAFFFIVTAFALLTLVLFAVKRQGGQGLVEWLKEQEYHRTLPRCARFLFNLTFPSMVAAGLQHFQCLSLDDSRYIRSDLSQQCEGDEYRGNSVVAAVALTQSALGPLLILAVLWWFSDQEESDFHDTYLSMFTRHYSKRAWCFEPLRLFRKAIFVSISELVRDPAEQTFLGTMLLVGSMALTAAVKPYTKSVRWIAMLDAAGQRAYCAVQHGLALTLARQAKARPLPTSWSLSSC
jgi:hypothetical protein